VNSLRVRLLIALLLLLAAAAGVMGVVTYRNVLAETESLFDYQLRQMALSLRDQGEIAADQARAFADEQLDFVVQIWTVDGRSIYASRPTATCRRVRCSGSPTCGWATTRGAPSASRPTTGSSRWRSRCRSASGWPRMPRCAASRRCCSSRR
jgi:hypothetical protein